MTEIVIVNDGQYRWGADRAELVAALEAQGWTRRGAVWTEPPAPGDEPEDIGHAYTRLCEAVQPLPGYGIDDRFDRPDLAAMVYQEDAREWWLDSGPL